MNRFILILMPFSVSLHAREEISPDQKFPVFYHMEQMQNTHDVDLERRLEFER